MGQMLQNEEWNLKKLRKAEVFVVNSLNGIMKSKTVTNGTAYPLAKCKNAEEKAYKAKGSLKKVKKQKKSTMDMVKAQNNFGLATGMVVQKDVQMLEIYPKNVGVHRCTHATAAQAYK